jgi:hypothetical protein
MCVVVVQSLRQLAADKRAWKRHQIPAISAAVECAYVPAKQMPSNGHDQAHRPHELCL